MTAGGCLRICAVLVAGLCAWAPAAQAASDLEKGKRIMRRCATCHSLEAGKSRLGPTLHKVIGRKAGTAPNYRYSQSYVDAGEKGLVWTEQNITDYLEDPLRFMRDYLGDPKAASRMVHKWKRLGDRESVVALLRLLQKQ